MTVIDIDETTDVGRDILRQVFENPEVGTVRDFEMPFDEDEYDDSFDDFPHFTAEELEHMGTEILTGSSSEEEIPLDDNGEPIGYSWEEVLGKMYDDFAEHSRDDLQAL